MSVPFRRKASAATVVAKLRSDPHAPFSAMIEIADRCNEVCVHCYQVQGQKGEISTSDWKGIIDQLAEMGVLFLTISGGEATLRADFLEIVEHARAKRFAVKLYTNGLTMTTELAQRLGALAVQEVQISLYSHRPELHDWVTRVPGSWTKTVDAARALIGAGVKVVLKSPLMSFNADDRSAYIELVTGLGADYSVDPHLDAREDGSREPERLRIDRRTYLEVMRDPHLARPRAVGRKKDLDRSVCGACSGNVHIEANGEMRPCTQLGVAVGNALREGVRAAWETNGDGRAIRALTWSDLHGCRDCDLQPYCGRCFANGQAEVGDAMAPYASACARARLEWELTHGREPAVEPAEGRDGTLGPYREIAPGTFRAIEDRSTPADEERASRHAWIRRAAGAPPSPEPVVAGALVQIRRPGARRARLETIPAGEEPAAVDGISPAAQRRD